MNEFPAWTLDAIEALQEEHDIRLTVGEELVGKSGAYVAFVDCDGNSNGTFVIKVGYLSSSYANEDELHEEVMQSRVFREKVPRIVAKVRHDGVYVLLLEIGGSSRIKWKPLRNTLGLFGSGYVRLIELLWDGVVIRAAEDTPKSIFRSWLDYKLDPANGRIEKHIRTYFGDELVRSDYFLCRGELYFNPLKFSRQSRIINKKMRTLYGPFHGDCHAGNVLTRPTIDGKVEDAIIIDFSSYRKSEPFFFDVLYFELAALLEQFKGVGIEIWTDLVESLVEEVPDSTGRLQLERGWIADIAEARRFLIKKVSEEHPHDQDALRLQFLLGGVAAGLSFINKIPNNGEGSLGLDKSQYLQAYVWAAIFLKKYCSEAGVQLPGEGAAIPNIMAERSSEISDDAEVFVDTLVKNDPQAFNILVLGPDFWKDSPDALTQVLPFSWRLVIDFGVTALPVVEMSSSPITYREVWRGGQAWDVKLLRAGGFWYFANGREDISESQPASKPLDWRRSHAKTLREILVDVSAKISPESVKSLVFSKSLSVDFLRHVVEELDSAFCDSNLSLLIAQEDIPNKFVDVDYLEASESGVLDRLVGVRPPAGVAGLESIKLPQRLAAGGSELASPPAELLNRTRRDLTPLGRANAQSLPPERLFGVDFRRGRVIEWAELDQNIDVARTPYYKKYVSLIDTALSDSNNSTVNLFHEPSAGGTTLGRRLAWDFKEKYPVVVLEQVSEDTSGYLRDLFQWSKLPILVLMDAAIITETAREALFLSLREDNTRTVFLWVARVYDAADNSEVLPCRLSREEAVEFERAYLAQVDEPARLREISRLANEPSLIEQCNPFFFGLVAFGEDYIGLDRLIASRVNSLSPDARKLLGSLALVSRYSSQGFPLKEFDEISKKVVGGVAALTAPFVVKSKTHIRLPHALIATKTLAFLARNGDWRADLHKFGDSLLSHIRSLANYSSDRILQLVQVVFLTRDTLRAIEGDADAGAGGLAAGRRFSPYIREIGSQVLGRAILERIATIWPAQPHHAVHYARHLLYEDPSNVDLAISVATNAEQRETGEQDDAVAHTVGMCWRVKMERSLDDARDSQMNFDSVSAEVRTCFSNAISGFDRSIVLSKASNEYGHVSTIQTVGKLIRGALLLSNNRPLPDFLRDSKNQWCVEALSLAERNIEILKAKPRLSRQADRAIATWDGVYGNIDAVINQLRQLMKGREDSEVRSALSRAIFAKHKRRWASVPQADLQTIVRLTDLNTQDGQVKDADMRMWFRAYRYLRSYDASMALRRVSEWQLGNPKSVEPSFYLYVIYFCMWLNGPRRDPALAKECDRWIDVCKNNRPQGHRGWGYEWLTRAVKGCEFTHFLELGFDPVAAIIGKEPGLQRAVYEKLSRIEGTIVRYKGPQQADLDIGHGLSLRFAPLDKFHRDDEGRRASVLVSFGYDGIRGWDARPA